MRPPKRGGCARTIGNLEHSLKRGTSWDSAGAGAIDQQPDRRAAADHLTRSRGGVADVPVGGDEHSEEPGVALLRVAEAELVEALFGCVERLAVERGNRHAA